MSKLYVTEYSGPLAGGSSQVASTPALVAQVVDFSGGVASSAAFSADTRLVRIHADATCSFLFGASPTATTSTSRLAAGGTEYFGVRPGDKVSAITNT